MNSQAPTEAGTILTLKHLGRNERPRGASYAADVFHLTYRSSAGGGATLAAKLFIPVGDPPSSGWPVSIWCHGLGDPATQLWQWPLTQGDWRQTRGELAGGWAHHGIVTLAPWLPGDGPSEPLGTYSPLSLRRNYQAVADAFAVLSNLEAAFVSKLEQADIAPKLDRNRLVLRTDCVSTALMVYFAAHWQTIPTAAGLKALVADDFQPSIAYNEFFLGPRLCDLPPRLASALRCIWLRVLWALAEDQGWPLSTFIGQRAIDTLSEQVPTPVGPCSRMMGSRLVPPQHSELGPRVLAAATKDCGHTPSGVEIRNWLFSPALLDWSSLGDLQTMVRASFYQDYLAASDPFFPETITPFRPGLPLFLVARSGLAAVNAAGLPTFSERYRNMTLPKIRTLQSWGWDIRVHETGMNQGTSFSGGAAQRWVLDRLGGI